jgi:hypothetical protein
MKNKEAMKNKNKKEERGKKEMEQKRSESNVIFGKVKILSEDSLFRISESFEVGRAVNRISHGFSLACPLSLICFDINNRSKENNLGLWTDYFQGGLI